MTDFPYEGQLIADPVTFQRATNAQVYVYDADDTTNSTPLALKDATGLPTANPLTSSADAFVKPIYAPSQDIKYVGAGLTVFVSSAKGMRDAAAASADAAQAAADSASAAAGNTVASASVNGAGELVIQKASGASLNAGSVKGPKGDKGDTGAPGQNGSNVLPTDAAIAQALQDPNSATRAAGNATYGTINGASIQGYDIIILAGQSNMSGRGTAFSAATDPVNPRIFQYKSKAPNANTIVAASEPLDMHDTPTGIGPGLQFARWYAARKLVGNRKVLLVPVAHGGTPLVSTNTLGWRRGVTGNLYANMVAQAQGALAAAGTGSRIVAALWLQGETDGDNGVTNVQYQTDLDALINGLRTDLSIPDLPFILGTMVPEYLSTGTRPAVNAVHRDTPNRIARTDVAVSASGSNNGDGNHFNAPGQRANGKAMFDAYERIMEGLAPYSESYVTPGQVTGLTAGTAGSASVPLTWSAVSGSTSYLMEYRVTGNSTWLNGGTSTGTSGTVSGLSGSTGYDFRVTASNSIASGAPSSTVTATTASPVYALGVTAAQPLGAYSLRKVVPSYSGSAVLARRSSDSATQAIGFSSGSLDTASLLTFAGAGDAFVVTWYDQSGNGKHVTQATAGAQPKIVSAGAVITSGGKPVVRFDGVDDILAIGSSLGLYAAGAATAVQVASAAQPSTQKRAWAESVSTSSSPQYGLLQPDGASSGTWPLAFPVATGQISWNSPGLLPTKTAWNSAIHQMSAVDTGSAMSQWIDAAADVSSFAYTRAAGWVMNTFALGGVSRSGSTASFAVDLSELVLWPAALSTAQRQTAEADQKTFYGTP